MQEEEPACSRNSHIQEKQQQLWVALRAWASTVRKMQAAILRLVLEPGKLQKGKPGGWKGP